MLAVLFDWDGVIIDSSAQHEESWNILAREENLTLPNDHFRRGFGKRNETIIPQILNWASEPTEVARLADRKESLYRELVAKEGVTVLPGAEDLLAELKAHDIPTAVGSSTPRGNLDAIFAKTHLDQYFRAVISGDDVTNGKPHPEVFLRGADALGAQPSHCIVIEDAQAGLDAARAGGMLTIGLTTTHPAEELTSTHLTVPNLKAVNLSVLRSLQKENLP